MSSAMLSASGALDTTQAIVFSMALVPSICVVLTRRKFRIFGWTYFTAFCVCRIIESALQLRDDCEGAAQPSSSARMLKEIAVALLLLSALCILYEGSRSMNIKSPLWIRVVYLSTIHIIAALGLSLAPGASGLYPNSAGLVYIKAAAALYMLLWVLLVAQALRSLFQHHPGSEERLLQLGVVATLPFFGIRVVYLVCSVATLSHATNPFTGPIVNRVFLGFLPEVFISCIILSIGTLTRHWSCDPSTQDGSGVQKSPSRTETAFKTAGV